MLSILVVWLTLLEPPSLPLHASMPPGSVHRHFHLRVLDPRLDNLIDGAIRQSETFASLVSRLETTDVIVHVDRVMTLPRSLRAHLAFAGAAGPARYLRVELRMNMGDKDTLATLAHELQHALEIGGAPEVRSVDDVCALYHRIGEQRDLLRFDSVEADAIGRQVQSELLEPRQF